jgi:hypothetical protein
MNETSSGVAENEFMPVSPCPSRIRLEVMIPVAGSPFDLAN